MSVFSWTRTPGPVGGSTWTNLLRKWFGPSGLELFAELPQFEGCS